MVALFYVVEDQSRAMVYQIHFQPDLLTEYEKENSILVEDIPVLEPQEGKDSVLYINLESKEIWYEFKDRPITPEEQLKLENEKLKEQLAALMNQ